MKLPVKILSALLSLAVLVSGMSLSLFASAEETSVVETERSTIETDLSKVDGLADKVKSDENIIAGYQNNKNNDGATFTLIGNNGSGESFVNEGNAPVLTDGDINTVKDFHGAYFFDADGNPYDGRYLKITVNFPALATINGFMFSSDSSSQLAQRTYEYEVYAANDLSTLYDAANLVDKYTNEKKSSGQYFTFKTALSARYFGIKVLQSCDPELIKKPECNYIRPYSYCRFKELAVFGVCKLDEYDAITSQKTAEECIKKLNSAENLIEPTFENTSNDFRAGTTTVCGYKNGKLFSFGGFSSGNNIFDRKANTHGDINIMVGNERLVTVVGEGNDRKYTDNVDIDLTLNLLYEANVSTLFIAQPNDVGLRSSLYEVYASTDRSTLYTAGNLKYTFENVKGAKYQTFTEKTPYTAKYIGIRIKRAVMLDSFTYPVNYAYPRIAEIAAFGSYNADYYDYSVTSNVEGLVSESGRSYSGKKITFTAPVYKDGYCLKGWQTADGKDFTDGITTDVYENTSVVEKTLTEALHLKAIYEPAATDFVGGSFKIDRALKAIFVPYGTAACELLNGFENNYRTLAVLDTENNELGGDTILKNGMSFIIRDKDNREVNRLTVYLLGDANTDGKITVSDIVAGTERILGSTAENANADAILDINADDRLTVTDLVKIRDTILNNDVLDNYENHYVKAEDLKYKYMGRKVVTKAQADKAGEKRDGILLEMTGSGILFNTNSCGDIYAEIYKGTLSDLWLTVIVDGEEHEVKLSGNAVAQDYLIARNLPRGVHSVEIYTQNESGTTEIIFGVKLTGEILSAPQNRAKLIDFVGDSITCGCGNLSEKGSTASGRHENGRKAYGVLTAETLGWDYSCISKSGSALVNIDGMANAHMPTEYLRYTYDRTRNPGDYDFSRKADYVVVNLGTNDNGLLRGRFDNDAERKAYFKEAIVNFSKTIAEKNGQDVKIVYAFGLMGGAPYMFEAYREVAAQLTAEGYHAYFCELPINTDGGSSHPSVAGDIAAAKVLSDFIKTID